MQRQTIPQHLQPKIAIQREILMPTFVRPALLQEVSPEVAAVGPGYDWRGALDARREGEVAEVAVG